MSRDEFFQLLREHAKIEIDRETGFAYVPVVNFGRDERGAIEAVDLTSLVNATIQLCCDTVVSSTIVSVEPTTASEVRSVFDTLKVK